MKKGPKKELRLEPEARLVNKEDSYAFVTFVGPSAASEAEQR